MLRERSTGVRIDIRLADVAMSISGPSFVLGI
jgi:hypothetical protein